MSACVVERYSDQKLSASKLSFAGGNLQHDNNESARS